MANPRIEISAPKSNIGRALANLPTRSFRPRAVSPSPYETIETEVAVYQGFGWLPTLIFFTALGICFTSLAYIVARLTNASWITLPYWVGILTMFVLIAIRMCQEGISRKERISLILLLTFGLYMFKISLSPNFLYLSDEFTHWLSTNNILKTQLLFQVNPILPTSAYYPGLHNVTAAFTSLSGIPIFHASILVIGATRIVLTMSLYLAFEKITSSRIASLASLLYAANPNFIFYGQQFGYESLSLPLMALVLYLVARRTMNDENLPTSDLNIFIVVLIFAIVPTHHMTSYVLIGLLGLWALVQWLDQRGYLSLVDRVMRRTEGLIAWLSRRSRAMKWIFTQLNMTGEALDRHLALPRPRPLGVTLFFLLVTSLTVIWLVKVATITIGYLSPVLGGAISELLHLISGEVAPKETFKAVKGFQAPLWERLISFGTIGLIIVGLPFGWFQTWRRYRRVLPAIVLMILSLLYPVTLAMRMTEKGSETANRSSEFLFISIGFVIAIAIVELIFRRGVTRLRLALVVTYMTVMFMGGLITGQAWWARLPGKYVVGGDTLSVQPESIKAAERAALILGRSNRVVADSLNLKMMASYGEQRIVRRLSWTFFSPKIHEPVQQAYAKNQVRYVVVDRRITRYLPINGFYFESSEPNSRRHVEPFDAKSLDKFDYDANLSRIFDSGNIIIYDIIVYRDKPLPPEEEVKK